MADQMTAENEKETEQETHGTMTSHGIVTLETLPNEIISSIAVMMTMDSEVPYVVSPLNVSLTMTPVDHKREDANARRDLTSLCMVSNRIAPSAQKALYRNILVDDVNTLILLYRTFLGNPKLGSFVKRMSLNIHHEGGFTYYLRIPVYQGDRLAVYESDSINLSPLLSCPQHGLGEHVTTIGSGSRIPRFETAIEIFYTLQLRVLSCTSNLDSLDLNVHPQFFETESTTRVPDVDMDEAYRMTVSKVLCSLWKDTSPSLSRLKKLQLMGSKRSFSMGGRSGFVALICERFLTLPKLQQLVWFNHADGWVDTFAPWTMRDIRGQLPPETESRFESIRTLELAESSCFPRDLVTLCSAFPNLQSLSIETNYDQIRRRMRSDPRLPHLLTDGDPNSDTGVNYLANSLATLENLETLTLDLHYDDANISQTLGPSGILSLAGLPNLQTLTVPFHFFVREELAGHHRVVSPAIVLPRSLKTLKLVACFSCLTIRAGEIAPEVPSTYQHADAVLEFLEGLSDVHAESFPSLNNICYEENEPEQDCVETGCWCYEHPFSILHRASCLEAISESLRQKGVTFERRDRFFEC